MIAPRKLLGKKTEPTEEALPQGIVVGCKGGKHSTTAMIDTGDVHVLMIGAAGVGKTAFWLYPCIEYACASGMSFLSTDMSVNGFMVTALSSTTVYKDKYAFGDITILSSSLEENGITSIDTIELKFKIYEDDTFKTIDTAEAVTFSAK